MRHVGKHAVPGRAWQYQTLGVTRRVLFLAHSGNICLVTKCQRALLSTRSMLIFLSLILCITVPVLCWSPGSHLQVVEILQFMSDINQPSLPTPIYSCVSFCLYGPFNCISARKFSRQLPVFSLCPSGLISALLVLSTICLFVKVSFSPDVIRSG